MKLRVLLIAAGLVAQAGSGMAAPIQVQEYKGRQIQYAADGSGSECMALLRRAIDMTAELPPRLRALTAEIRDLRCSPIPKENRTNAVAHNTVGVYTMESPDVPGGYIRFPLKPGEASAADTVLSLLGNGTYARWHRTYLAAKQRGGSGDPVARKYHTLLTKSDVKALLMAECEMLENDHAAIMALGLGVDRAAYIGKRMDVRGCPI
ncbi:conserved exported protein of unknown function [Magnetospirillum sp. XM-1]|uniref:hypothetical protein n=1 Tax=Magnetospirillum sp. XM-1 TaxID=1663591 RepID=UPI00073DC391|nr:hypothetical protein [Magnetospirillum sp. XM-1]CUW37470.1 conserved exported protein of unknown function [Magnetospirillum sp. XM-1]